MGSGSKFRSIGFVALSILAHIAVAAGIVKYSLQSSDEIQEVPETTQIEIEAATSPIEGNQKAEAPTLMEVPREAEAPSAAVTMVKPTPEPQPAESPEPEVSPALPAKSVAKAETIQKAPVKKIKPVAKPAGALPTKAVKTSSDSKPQNSQTPVTAVAVQEPSNFQTESTELNTEEEESIDSTKTIETAAEDSPATDLVEESSVEVAEDSADSQSAPSAPIPLQAPKAPQLNKPESGEPQYSEEAVERQEAEEDKVSVEQKALVQPADKGLKAENEKTAAAAVASEVGKEAEMSQEAGAPIQAEESKQAESSQPVSSARPVSNGSNPNSPRMDEVRGIEDLRQIPGNKRPQYDAHDRLQGRQGEVVFVAYVSKEGSLASFRILKSSGHRELDAKTLKALHSWKFYPGQEGWVEIPFKWDLKGGPQEMPTTLRRRAQVSQ